MGQCDPNYIQDVLESPLQNAFITKVLRFQKAYSPPSEPEYASWKSDITRRISLSSLLQQSSQFPWLFFWNPATDSFSIALNANSQEYFLYHPQRKQIHIVFNVLKRPVQVEKGSGENFYDFLLINPQAW